MNKKHNELYHDDTFLSDDRLVFECRQAMLRKEHAAPAVDSEWEKFRETIQPSTSLTRHHSRTRIPRPSYFIFGILAGSVAVALLFLLFFWHEDSGSDQSVMIFVAEEQVQDITMHIGSKSKLISTSDTEMQDIMSGVVINSHKADFTKVQDDQVQQRTIHTPYGKDYKIVLNDGTEVILNAGSALTFPTRFSGNERVVTLEGEAYFQVVTNPQLPFIVKTDKITAKALGTEFNVKAYKGSDPHVTLIKGIVIVDIPEMNREIKMLPSEDVSLVLIDKSVKIKEVNPQYYIQWKDGFLYYDNMALGEILSDIGRWYNVNIEIEKSSLKAYRLHFVVDRNAGIEEVVDNLNEFKYLQAVKNGNKITVKERKY